MACCEACNKAAFSKSRVLVSAVVGRDRLGLVRLLRTTLKLESMAVAEVVGRAVAAVGVWVETAAVFGDFVPSALFWLLLLFRLSPVPGRLCTEKDNDMLMNMQQKSKLQYVPT